MESVTIQEAQARLADLIHRVMPGREIVITENDQPVARLVPALAPSQRKGRQLGTLKGTVLYMAPDFDAPLEDLKDFIE